MKYRSVIVAARGGPESLQVVEQELHPPASGEVCIRVLASLVSAPDITARRGHSPLLPKLPFTPGYCVIGDVEAVGEDVRNIAVGDRVGALTAFGGYSEYVYWDAKQLIPVPPCLEPGEAVPLILNYIVAYHVMHRWGRVKAGDKVLIIGASGGIGTALLQLGRLANLKMYAIASRNKHHILQEYGAVPIDYRTQDFVDVIRQAEPDGVDAVFDGMAGDYVQRGFSVLKRGGTFVGYANPLSFAGMFKTLGLVLLFHMLPNGRSAKYYSTGMSRINPRIFLEDWATLFRLLEEGKIKPIIAAKFPILEAGKANALLENGAVIGNVVLVSTELMEH